MRALHLSHPTHGAAHDEADTGEAAQTPKDYSHDTLAG